MKPVRSHLAILTFLCGLSAIALGPVVPLRHVKGAPFQATLVKTSIRSGQQTITSGTVARNSNGSTYWEVAGAHPGLDSIIIIYDVSNHRTITLYQRGNFYSIGPLDATIPISDAPSLQVVKQRIAQCENKQTYHNSGDGYDSSATYLGSRMQNGFVECGNAWLTTRFLRPVNWLRKSGRTGRFLHWTSPLNTSDTTTTINR
jgi:hypothetical protein